VPTFYEAKKLALLPLTRYRAATAPTTDRFGAAMLDLHYHRPTIYRFARRHAQDPDILVRADIDEHSTVIDAGAHVGDWATQISDRYHPTIHAFEPAPGAARQFRRRLGDRSEVHLHPWALGARDEMATMALAGPGSTLGTVADAFGSTEVQVRDILGVLDELELRDVDLLKVNIEGGEYDLFDRLIHADMLRRFRIISVQFHEWLPRAHRRRWAIRRALRRTHEEQWCYPWVWEVWERRPDTT
jgi:FkbM family methyltransferase